MSVVPYGKMELTPHPMIDMVVGHFFSVYGNMFMVEGVMDSAPPISINKMYTTFRGKRHLTKAGETYRDALTTTVARSSFEWKRAHEMVYQKGGGATLLLLLYFETLNNHSWKPGTKTEKGLPSEPRKVQDASNYIKLAEDAVARGCGINDCNNITVLATKAEDKLRPRTELLYIVTP